MRIVNALAAAAVIAVVVFSGPSDGRAFELVRADGAVTLSNSKEGVAILGGSNLRPGQRSTGSVTIANPGTTTSALALEIGAESETPGTGGGRLWPRMWISIADAGGVIYDGRVADLGRLALGALAAGNERRLTLTAWIAGGDNTIQGAQLSLRFTWLAEADAAPAPTSTAEPTATPAPPTPGAPAPPADLDPNGTVTAEELFSLPSSKTCLSKRRLRVRVRAKPGVKVRSVRVYVNQKRMSTSKGKKATIDLRGLPRGTVRVTLRATLSNGRTLTLKRTYRTCVKSSRPPGTARSKAPR
jgi:hypothetical protein